MKFKTSQAVFLIALLPLHLHSQTDSPAGRASPATEAITGKGGMPYAARINAAGKLGRRINPSDRAALVGFLHRKYIQENEGISLMEFNAIKNDVAAAIINSDADSASAAGELIEMRFDPDFDDTWRDYCVQFLGTCLGKTVDEGAKRKILEALRSTAEERNSSLAGTALASLEKHAAACPAYKEELSSLAMKTVASADSAEAAKITALQICARLGRMDALEKAKEILASESAGVHLKMSAAAAVGILGSDCDKQTLEALLRSGDPRIRTAAKAAIDALDKKN